MKTNIHFLSYLALFFLEWEMFQTKDNIKPHILCSITFFFRKSCRLWDNVERYGRARQATDDDRTRRMCFAFWISTAMLLHGKRMANRTCLNLTIIRTLPLLFPNCIYVWNSLTAFVITAKRVTFLAHLILPDLLVLTVCGPCGGDHKIYRNAALSATSVPTFRRNMCTRYMRENQQMYQLLFNLLVMYDGSYMFRHYITILRERS
jgi:hypothetical protein